MSLRLSALVALVSVSMSAHAISREEVLVRARSFAAHPWRMGASNVRGTCNSAYRSIYSPGDYMGLPYDWGGYMSAFEFDQQILGAKGAGSYPSDGVLACTAGVDCSGFVSQAWSSGHYTTRSIPTASTQLSSVSQLLAGDVMNQAGYHVAMFSHTVASGAPVFIESVGYNVHVNASGGWSYVDGYLPNRYKNITGTTAGNPLGTATNPIVIASLPYQDARDTKASTNDYFDGCNAAPTKNESGPEYVYKLQVTRPGQLTVSVSDDAGVDIDVHLFKNLNTTECVARHDSTFTYPVDCGTYYIVADTYGGSTNAGRYTMNVSLAPAASSACGTNGPMPYNFAGKPGAACSYPGNENLPFCNENLGSETCIYTSGTRAISFCSHACRTNADCGDFAGGCCDEVGSGETYCMVSSLCGSTGPGPSTGGLDAGTTADLDLDAGTPYIPPDAGPSYVDAGAPARDAGPSYVDAGTPAHDAGPSYVDAGIEPDPDPVEEDAGYTPPAPKPDAGTTTTRADAGHTTKPDPNEGEGFGCSTGGSAGALFALLLRRRRARRA